MKNFCPGPKNFFFEAHKVDTQDAITRERDSNGEEKRSEREREHFPSCHKKQLSQKERYCHPLNPSWQCSKRRSAAFICTLSPSLSLVKNKGYSLVLEERASPDIEEAFAMLSTTFSLVNFPSILLCIGISLARWPLACVEVPCGFRF